MPKRLYFVPAAERGRCAATVYLDSVFVLNFLVNYLLLRTAARLSAASARPVRLALSAAFGGLYAVAVWLPACQWLQAPLMKLVVAVSMLLLAFGARRSTARVGAVFAGITLVLCGAVYGVELLRSKAVTLRDGSIFYPVTVPSLVLTAGAVALLSRLVLPRLTHAVNSTLPVTLERGGKAVRLTALIDSGNTLCDPVSGAPVLTVYWKAARRLLPEAVTISDFERPDALALRLRALHPRLIPYRAVGTSSGLLFAVPCRITLGDRNHTGLVAFSPTPLSDGGAYEALTGGITYA